MGIKGLSDSAIRRVKRSVYRHTLADDLQEVVATINGLYNVAEEENRLTEETQFLLYDLSHEIFEQFKDLMPRINTFVDSIQNPDYGPSPEDYADVKYMEWKDNPNRER